MANDEDAHRDGRRPAGKSRYREMLQDGSVCGSTTSITLQVFGFYDVLLSDHRHTRTIWLSKPSSTCVSRLHSNLNSGPAHLSTKVRLCDHGAQHGNQILDE